MNGPLLTRVADIGIRCESRLFRYAIIEPAIYAGSDKDARRTLHAGNPASASAIARLPTLPSLANYSSSAAINVSVFSAVNAIAIPWRMFGPSPNRGLRPWALRVPSALRRTAIDLRGLPMRDSDDRIAHWQARSVCYLLCSVIRMVTISLG